MACQYNLFSLVSVITLLVCFLVHPLIQGNPLLEKRQGGGGGGNGRNGGTNRDLTRFPSNVNTLTAWQALQQNPSFGNFTILSSDHSPSLLTILNSTSPSTNLTVFAPYDPAFEPIVTEPLFNYANTSTQFDPVWTQYLAYHIANSTTALYTQMVPPPPANITIPTLSGFNVTAQRSTERPPPPMSISQTSGNKEMIYINDARVILANITVTNGVIHVIDQLLSPLFILPPILSTTTLPPIPVPTMP